MFKRKNREVKSLKEENENDEVSVKEEESSLAEFTRRPLATEEQVENFEERIEAQSHDTEVEKSLNEIYHDDDGELVDVQKIKILKKRGFFFWFFSFIFTIAFVGGLGYGFYYFIYKNIGSNAKAVDFTIEGETEVIAGEEFIYTLKYKNSINVGINNLQVTVVYPTNFIISDINPQPVAEKNSVWNIPFLGPGQTGEIKIRGKIIGMENELGVISGYVTYVPDNFSSEFKREATLTTVVKDVGIDFDFDYANIALAGQESEIVLFFESKDNNFINNFRLTVEPQDNVEILSTDAKTESASGSKLAKYSVIRPGVWQVDEVLDEQKELTIKYKILQKVSDKQELVLNFEQVGGDNQYFRFYQKKIELDVMNNDLNVNLIINGSRSDQGVGLGDTLNYSIVYANRGETEMKDIVIMATLDSTYLNWDSLTDKNNGQLKRNTITWTKEQIPGLESLAKNAEGSIDFSIKLARSGNASDSSNYEIKSYAQFSVGSLNNDSSKDSENNRSNVIINKINSDLKISESVRYFSEDNIPVGSGPNPPKIGQQTTYKTYWKLENTIHELDELAVRVKLPAYVAWDNKVQASAGNIQYDSATNEVLWFIGRLPSTVNEASGEFSISITPGQNDLNKILILLPGSKVSALDSETGAEINLTTKAQTTKLDGDEIGSGDGIVQ